MIDSHDSKMMMKHRGHQIRGRSDSSNVCWAWIITCVTGALLPSLGERLHFALLVILLVLGACTNRQRLGAQLSDALPPSIKMVLSTPKSVDRLKPSLPCSLLYP